MKRIVYYILAMVLFVSCELADNFGDAVASKQGNDKMKDASLVYFSREDSKKILTKIAKNKKVDPSKFMFTEFSSLESYETSLARHKDEEFDAQMYAFMNPLEVEEYYFMNVNTNPTTAKVDKVTIESSDEDIMSFTPTKNPTLFMVNLNGVGECDVKMVVEGKNTLERNYHIRVVATVQLLMYMDSFWKTLISGKARIKYKPLKMPKGMSILGLYTRDSATVIAMSRIFDMRDGSKGVKALFDTTTYPIHEKCRYYRKGYRYKLRNVGDAVFEYTFKKTSFGYIKISPSQALQVENADKIPFTVRKKNDNYYLDILGNTLSMDKYQVNWIKEVQKRCGKWPFEWEVYSASDGQKYLKYTEIYICKRVECSMDILSSNPYLVFSIQLRKCDNPTDVEEDEEDDNEDDWRNEGDDVVDSLGTTLKEYFEVMFIENLTAAARDSLSREVDKMMKNISDSTKWKLNY